MGEEGGVPLPRTEPDAVRRDPARARLGQHCWRARVRILVVTEGSGTVDPTSALGRALAALQENNPAEWVRFEIVTAHRGLAPGADHVDFRFDTPPVALSGFDQLWLCGVQPAPALPASEVAALAAFMDSGGGVLAVGDHSEPGAGLSGDLPRISEMRRRRSGRPSDDGPAHGPQSILPTRYYDPFRFSVLHQRWRPHPVLCGPDGVLDVLPGQVHEGECVAPSEATVAADPETWPGGYRPEVIARVRVEPNAPHLLAGRSFGVLSAYDGHRAGVGRILTATHWLDSAPTGADHGSAHDTVRSLLQNVAVWLAPSVTQDAMFCAAVYGLIWLPPFDELQIRRGSPLLALGSHAVDALGRRASPCVVNDWLLAQLPAPLRDELYRRPVATEPEPQPLSAGLETVRELVVGAILESLRRHFDPFDPPAVPPEQALVAELVAQGVRRGIDAVVEVELRGLDASRRRLDLLEKARQRC